MKKEFDVLVFIGRFQPLHKGHVEVIKKAETLAKKVVVIVGSSFAARSTRNPFTFYERKEMVKAEFPKDNVVVLPVMDYPYNDLRWVAAIQSMVLSAIGYTPDPIKIGLIGHKKDHTSYYLNIFKTWGSIDVDSVDNINATTIRNKMFEERCFANEFDTITPKVANIIDSLFEMDEEFENISEEFRMVKAYKEAWKVAPYAPTFVTTDAVVHQTGKVLLITRGKAPGKGLLALPGGFLSQNETIFDGMIRELKEETKLKVPEKVLRHSVSETKVFDAPNRDPRGRTITHAFYIDLGFGEDFAKVKGSDDASHAGWYDVGTLKSEDFYADHFHIINHFIPIY